MLLKKIGCWALVPVAIVVVVVAMLGFSRLAHAGEIFKAGPFAASRDEAMRNRLEAFLALDSGLDLPAAAIIEMMQVTDGPSQRIKITAGENLLAMAWGDKIVRYNVKVIPDVPFLPAESWKVRLPGETFYVLLISLPGQHFYNWGLAVSYTTLACSAPAGHVST